MSTRGKARAPTASNFAVSPVEALVEGTEERAKGDLAADSSRARARFA